MDISRALLRGKGLATTGIVTRITADASHSLLLHEAVIALDLQDSVTSSLSLCCTYKTVEDAAIKCSLWSQQLSDDYVINHFQNVYLVNDPNDSLKEYTRILIETFLDQGNFKIVSNNTMSEVSILLTYKNPVVFQGKMKLLPVQSNVDVRFFNIMRVLHSMSQPTSSDVTNDTTEDTVQQVTKKLKTNSKQAKKSNIRGVFIGGSNR